MRNIRGWYWIIEKYLLTVIKGSRQFRFIISSYKDIRKKELFISNIDSTIIAQKSKIGEYIDERRENLTRVCKIDKEEIMEENMLVLERKFSE